MSPTNVLLRALILTGVIVFAFFVVFQYGLIQLALASDRSYLSTVILLLYTGASIHWLVLAGALSREAAQLALWEQTSEESGDIQPGLVGSLRVTLLSAESESAREHLISASSDQLLNRHALGHFASDALLRLGLLGTIIGFILMLLPVSEISDFDAAVMQQLLAEMSGGMAVALYTTLTGIIASTLLRLQYHLIDSAAVEIATRLTLQIHRSSPDAP